jgi:hypothetical protein
MPPDPEVQRLAGRIAGATDPIRDVLTGRNGRRAIDQFTTECWVSVPQARPDAPP